MGYEALTGLGVSNQYGQRFTGNAIGLDRSQSSIHELAIEFTGRSLNETFLPPVVIPKGALFLRYRLRVDEAFGLTGTTPTVIFGGTAPATNGVILSEAELEAIGTKTPASVGTGTWATTSATGTTASEKITKTLGGTTPVVDPLIGKATLIAEYVFETLV